MSISLMNRLMMGAAMPFAMNEAGDGGGSGGGEGGGSGADNGAASATDDGTGGKAPFGQTGNDGGGEGEGGEDGGSKKMDLKTILGEELAGNKTFEKFKDSENFTQDLAKSYAELEKQVGKAKVGVPDENSTPEQKAEFYKALGVPESGEGYKFDKPEGMPDEAYDADHAAKWANLLHENNVPAEAANNLRNAMIQEGIEQHNQATAALNEALEKTFGDKKSVISKEIGDLMTKAVPDQALRETIQNSLTDEQTPAFALALGLAMQHMKKTYGQSDTNMADGGDGSGGKSIQELREDAKKKMSSEAYRDPMHKDHGTVKKEVNDMYKEIGMLTNQQQKG